MHRNIIVAEFSKSDSCVCWTLYVAFYTLGKISDAEVPAGSVMWRLSSTLWLGDAVLARQGNVHIHTIVWIGRNIDIARLDKE